ncbi:MAG TPA: hypothetical protein VN380_09855 [Thermoanaerobaculia bacterium]|nr:hypothetical protein [Thermoanaerobaculia bacterium]
MKKIALLLLVSALPAYGANALFPKALHLVKRIDDPFARSAKNVDEYCYGNRIVTVAGDRVTILDYDAQTLTEIDHARGTYSITRFDEIANARPKMAAKSNAAPKITQAGMKRGSGGRSVDTFDVELPGTKVTIGVDRSVTLSRAAVEALIGSSYPNAHHPEHDAILGIASPARRGGPIMATSATDGGDATGYALPSEQAITMDAEGGAVTVRTSVLRFDADLPPQNAMLIEPGAKRVESPVVRFAREMKEADTIPVAPRP